MAFPWLSASILCPIAASLLIPFVPDAGDGRRVRWYALGVALFTFLLTVGAYLNGYDPSDPGLQLVDEAAGGKQTSLARQSVCLVPR